MHIIDLQTMPTDSFAPLSLLHFSWYFLIPFTATYLISQDLKCNFKLAFEEMMDSAHTSDNLHHIDDDDEDLDRIMKANITIRMQEYAAKITKWRR
ncbi:hypothetical protein J3R82DRAFT_7728 [Butyriboletus roseoflavus]|nr:hypothetical protein J3R82DRAFT_7728 [Butyriboletus roseoflavus]